MKNKFLTIIKKLAIYTIFIIGFALTFNRPIMNYLINSYHPIIENFTVLKTKPNIHWNDVRTLNLFSVIEARLAKQDIPVIGGVFNEKIGLNTPIYNGANNDCLALGAGVLLDHEHMGIGNYVLAGHNLHGKSDALFSPLYYKASPNTIINITDFKKVYQYQIYKKQVIKPDNLSILQQTATPKLTLITCNNDDSKRLVLTAKLVKIIPYEKLSAHTKKFLAQKYVFK